MGQRLEIVSPAGSLAAGLHALSAGADAVYFGLSSFSARAAAENLSLDDVRRLKGAAEVAGGRIFAAFNTVIAEEEREAVARTIPALLLSGVDGIIVQDLGLAAWLREHYPELPLHGSTQLAVHNRAGLEAAAELGFSRVVLARELSIREIGDMKGAAPSVTREVFVHGALCYGFSGLCLASAALTGRSGNRGACAQICRSWFEQGDSKGYYFSLGDLDAGALLPTLAAAGVGAIKIEGRLKSLAYVRRTTAYYRALLEGDMGAARRLREESALAFSRPKTTGYLDAGPSNPLTCPNYPSHVGVPGAVVVGPRKGGLAIRALTALAAHDRLFRIPDGPPDSGETIPIREMRVGNRKRRSLAEGETAVLPGVSWMRPGTVLRKTLSHDMHLKQPSPGRYKEHKAELPLYVAADTGTLRLGTTLFGTRLERVYTPPIAPGAGSKRFTDIISERFREAPGYPFGFDAVLPFSEDAPLPGRVFVPPSRLKAIRKDFFAAVAARIEEQALESAPPPLPCPSPPPLPARERIVYPDGFPFVTEGDIPEPDAWPLIDGRRFLALPPLMLHETETVPLLTRALERATDRPVAVGLNNIAHLSVSRSWRSMPHVSFFVDYGLYTANHWTTGFWHTQFERLHGAYVWLEATDAQQRALLQAGVAGLRSIAHPERFPLFISRTCFHGFPGRERCREACSGAFEIRLVQNGRGFRVVVKRCITYLFLEEGVTNPESRAGSGPAGSVS